MPVLEIKKIVGAAFVTAVTFALSSAFSLLRVEAQRVAPLPKSLVDTDFLYDGTPPEVLVELGRNLFFDPILSGNRNISCGTCHDPARGTSDGVALSIGEGGSGFGPNRRTADGVTERIPRNAQALWNIGAREYRSMFHDGRVEPDMHATFQSGFWTPAREHLPAGLNNLLAAQAMFPVLSASEMAGQKGENPVATAVAEDRVTDAWDLLATRLAEVPQYREMFGTAFPGEDNITMAQAANAMAAFQSQKFRSDGSPFDDYLAGDQASLGSSARAGLDLFYGKAGCAECHSGSLPPASPGPGSHGSWMLWSGSMGNPLV